MALMLEITKADGTVARTPLESQATKVAAWPGGKVRVIDTATGKSPANLTAKRIGDSLIVENLPDGKSIEITKFYTDCTPAAQCALVIDPADAAQAATITQTTPPVATLGENQALMYGPTSSGGAAAAAPAAAGGGMSTGAVLAGLGLLGVAAAAGGGGGGGSKTPADTTPPDAPVVNTVAGNGTVDAAEAAAGVAVSGTAEANSTVTVTWGTTSKTATADANGAWSVNFTQAELPADGPSTISATARDAAGNVSSAGTQAVTVNIGAPDTTAPDAPVIAAVAGDDVVNAAEAGGGVDVSGTAEAGSTVEVTWGSATETATTDGAGNWTVTFASGDVPGDGPTVPISATATDAAGNTSVAGTRNVAIDTGVPAAPTVAVAPNGIVSGTAEAGSTVTMGDQEVTADAGTGAFAFATPLASGASASVVATDAAGNASAPANAPTVTYATGTAGNDVMLAGTTGFVDGGDGNDVLIGGAGGSVRNYQFDYWDTPAAEDYLFMAGETFFTYSETANTGWTVGTTPSSILAGDPAVEQFTGGRAVPGGEPGLNVLSNSRGVSTDDLTGGGGRFTWDTVRNEVSGTTLSQDIFTQADAEYTLTMQVSANDYATSLGVYWGGELLGLYDGIANEWTSGTAPTGFIADAGQAVNDRETWTWTVTGAPATSSTTLEIRAYSADGDDGQGMLVDRVTLDAAADNAETLAGGAGNDLLFGQAGDDTLYGGALGDTATATDGDADTFVYSMRADNGNDVIKDFEVGVDRIYLVDALDTYTTDSLRPSDENVVGFSTTNADSNLSPRDFLFDDSIAQFLTVTGDGSGSVMLGFSGMDAVGAAAPLGSVVLEGVAYGTDAGQYNSVEDLFAAGVLVATMDGFHAGLAVPV